MLKTPQQLDEIILSTDFPASPDELCEARDSNEKLENRLGIAKVERFMSDTDSRKKLVCWFTTIIAGWLLLTIGVLYLILLGKHKDELSDSVLITLLTTTTVNVIGMMLIILKDLFPKVLYYES